MGILGIYHYGKINVIIMAKSMFCCTVNTVDAVFFVTGLIFVVVVVYVRITYQRCAVHFQCEFYDNKVKNRICCAYSFRVYHGSKTASNWVGGGGGTDLKTSLIHVWAVCGANSFFFVYCCFHCGSYAAKSFTFCDMSTTYLGDGSNKGARQKK